MNYELLVRIVAGGMSMEKYYEIRLSSVGIAVCMVVFGAILIIYPEISGIIFARGFATVVLLFALSHIWKWRQARKYEMSGTGSLVGAVLLLLLSAIGFFKSEILLGFLPFVTGSLLILDGFVKIPLIKEMWDWGSQLRWSAILSTVLPLLLGIILAAYPFHVAAAVIRVFGIFLFIDGVSDIVRNAMIKRKDNY